MSRLWYAKGRVPTRAPWPWDCNNTLYSSIEEREGIGFGQGLAFAKWRCGWNATKGNMPRWRSNFSASLECLHHYCIHLGWGLSRCRMTSYSNFVSIWLITDIPVRVFTCRRIPSRLPRVFKPPHLPSKTISFTTPWEPQQGISSPLSL